MVEPNYCNNSKRKRKEGRKRKGKEGGRSVDLLVLFRGSFKDPRYCSLVFFRQVRGEGFQKDLDHGMGTIR